MVPHALLDEPSPLVTDEPVAAPSLSVVAAPVPPAELVRRHLRARLVAARAELAALEEAPITADGTLVRLGARVAEAQRVLAVERAQAEHDGAEVWRRARAQAARVAAEAATEVQVLRAVTDRLRKVPVAGLVAEPEPCEAAS